jgi:hypothetical protein
MAVLCRDNLGEVRRVPFLFKPIANTIWLLASRRSKRLAALSRLAFWNAISWSRRLITGATCASHRCSAWRGVPDNGIGARVHPESPHPG